MPENARINDGDLPISNVESDEELVIGEISSGTFTNSMEYLWTNRG